MDNHLNKNEPDFMASVYSTYERMMFYIASQFFSDLFQQEEIVQSALVRLLKMESTLRGLSQAAKTSYIASTIRNTAINRLKKESREKALYISIDTLPQDDANLQIPPIDLQLLEAERRHDLLLAFSSLSEDDQYLLTGKYVLGLSDDELSCQLQCKPGSIRMKMTRARRRLLGAVKKRESHYE